MKKISIITVCLNNVEGLEKTIRSIAAQTYKDFEFIVIDDGSTDGSLEVLRELYAADPTHMRVLSFRRNQGKSAGLAAGFEAARGSFVVTLDADLQDDPAEVPRLLAALAAGADAVDVRVAFGVPEMLVDRPRDAVGELVPRRRLLPRAIDC